MTMIHAIHRLTMRYKGNYRQLYLMFMMVFLVPLGVTIVLSQITTNALEHQSETTASAVSAQIQTTIDNRMDDLNRLADQINNHSTIRYILNRRFPLGAQDRYMISTIIRDLRTQYVYHSAAQDLFIYLPGIDTVITPQTKVNSRFFYEKYLTYLDADYDAWIQDITHHDNEMRVLPARTARLDGKTRRIITVLQSLPRGDSWQRSGTLALLMDETELLSQLAFPRMVEGAEIHAIDGRGKVIFTTHPDRNMSIGNPSAMVSGLLSEEMDGKPYLLSFIKSRSQDWYYVYKFPKSQFFAEVEFLKRTVLITLLLLSACGVLLAALMTYINMQPVKSLLHTMQVYSGASLQTDGKGNVSMQYLGTVAEQVVRNNAVLVDQLPRLIEGCVFKLIHGSVDVQEDLNLLREVLGFRFPSQVFSVMCLRMPEAEDMQVSVLEALRKTQAAFDDFAWPGLKFYGTQATDRSIAALVCFEDGWQADPVRTLREAAQRLITEVQQRTGVACLLGLSQITRSYQGISNCYRQAVMALARAKSPVGLVLFSDITDAPLTPDYSFTLVMEKALIGCVLTGDSTRAQGLIRDVFPGRDRDPISPDILQCLKFDLLGTVYRCFQENRQCATDADQKQLSSLIRRWTMAEHMDEIRDYALSAFDYLCAVYGRQKHSQPDQLLQGVLAYIGENYSDPDMGLEKVADAFGVAPGYLSRFVKEKSGSNFLAILNNHRIQRAAALLKTTDMSHQHIAEACGLSGAQALNRLFSRTITLTPSAYRQAARGGISGIEVTD